MPYLIAAVLALAVATVVAAWRADNRARRDRDCSPTRVTPPPTP